MPTNNIPIYKTMLYQLCYFLLEKRLSPEGIGLTNPILIPLREFERVINKSGEEDFSEKLKDFSKKITLLSKETTPTNIPLLEILNPDVILQGNIENSFRNNVYVELKYKRLDIHEYLEEMNKGNERIAEGENFDKVVFEPRNLTFKYQGKIMSVEKGSGTNQHIRANLCLLLFGYKALFESPDLGSEMTIKNKTNYDDYEPGDPIEFDTLASLVLSQGDDESFNPVVGLDSFRPIREAVNALNGRAETELNIKIFEITQPLIKIIAPI